MVSLHLAFSVLMFHLRLLFLHGHFETNLTDAPVRTTLRNFPDPKSAGQAHFRTSDKQFGYLAKSVLHIKAVEKVGRENRNCTRWLNKQPSTKDKNTKKET